MKTWQIVAKAGYTYGIIKAVTAQGALDKWARERGFKSWENLNSSLAISPIYKVIDNNKILTS